MQLHTVQALGRSIGDVVRPPTLIDALHVLRDDPAAHPIAGGTDLILDLERGESGPPARLVDLSLVRELATIDVPAAGGAASVSIGALTTHAAVISHPGLGEQALPLVQACAEIGSPQLRNRATVAGNIVTASPANDTISALLAMDASVDLARLDADGELVRRSVPLGSFITGFRSTDLAAGELVTALRWPQPSPTQRSVWMKVGNRRAQAISIVHAGIVLDFDGSVVSSARAAIGSVAATVVMADEFASALIGEELTDDRISSAAAAAAAALEPIDDVRATADYRRMITRTVLERGVRSLRDASGSPPGPPPVVLAEPTASPARGSAGDARPDTFTLETPVEVTVNGAVTRAAGSNELLLDWLRDRAGLTGSKEGCAEGECGACTVVVDGAAVMSCLVVAGQADGSDVLTVEGLARDERLHALQQAFVDEFAVQCGFCIPGFLVAGATLLEEHPNPTREQIEVALSGNLCRCTGYYPIVEAVHAAAAAVGGGQ